MFVTYIIKDHVHYDECDCGVYLREILDMLFFIFAIECGLCEDWFLFC